MEISTKTPEEWKKECLQRKAQYEENIARKERIEKEKEEVISRMIANLKPYLEVLPVLVSEGKSPHQFMLISRDSKTLAEGRLYVGVRRGTMWGQPQLMYYLCSPDSMVDEAPQYPSLDDLMYPLIDWIYPRDR